MYIQGQSDPTATLRQPGLHRYLEASRYLEVLIELKVWAIVAHHGDPDLVVFAYVTVVC